MMTPVRGLEPSLLAGGALSCRLPGLDSQGSEAESPSWDAEAPPAGAILLTLPLAEAATNLLTIDAVVSVAKIRNTRHGR